jgi:hypothetical protein
MSSQRGIWFRWTPENAGSPLYRDLEDAISKFESLETPAGEASARWLRNDALSDYPSTITHVLKVEDQVDGFFAISSDRIELKKDDRKRLPHRESSPIPSPFQGASLISWIARHREGTTYGQEIMLYAISIALKVARLQGTPVVVLDPLDKATEPETTQRLMDRYSFRSAAAPDGGGVRLWLPLHPAEV